MNSSRWNRRGRRSWQRWLTRGIGLPLLFTLFCGGATAWTVWDGLRGAGFQPAMHRTSLTQPATSAAGFVDTRHLTSQPLPTAQNTGKYLTCPIRDLPVATWILAENPESEGNLGFDYSLFDPSDLCILKLRMTKPDGELLHIDKLEFTDWLKAEQLTVGSTFHLEYEELGISSDAEILSIAPCPRIPPRPSEKHCLVTSKFAHEATNVLDLYLGGLNEPIGVTANHPLCLDISDNTLQLPPVRASDVT